MEEVDAIVLRALAEANCDFGKKSSLKELSPENVIEAIVQCLRLIKPDINLSTVRMPADVISRFRFATVLADAIKELGYKGAIGYESILYGSEGDSRRLLMFLAEKLPKTTESFSGVSKTSNTIEEFKQLSADRLLNELKRPQIPWFLRRNQRVSHCSAKFLAHYAKSLEELSLFLKQDGAFCTAIAFNEKFSSRTSKLTSYTSDRRHNDDICLMQHLIEMANQGQKVETRRKAKPMLPPKPARRHMSKSDQPSEIDEEQLQSGRNPEKDLEEELKHEVSAIEVQLERNLNILAQYEDSFGKLTNAMKEIQESLKAKEAQFIKLNAVAKLTADGNENMQLLKDHIAQGESRMEAIAQQRDELCANIMQQIADIKRLDEAQNENHRIMKEISLMEEKIDDLKAEEESKRNHLKNLEREYGKMDKASNRTYYTKRILEIIANINKQKEEIARVLADIHASQKDINLLSGKLERCFMATDELLFEDAGRDEVIKRAYKSLIALHEYCGEIVQRVESAGAIDREIRNLDAQIDFEKQRAVEATLEKIVNDYCELKIANDSLLTKLKQSGINI